MKVNGIVVRKMKYFRDTALDPPQSSLFVSKNSDTFSHQTEQNYPLSRIM